jgi:hypothetical protein
VAAAVDQDGGDGHAREHRPDGDHRRGPPDAITHVLGAAAPLELISSVCWFSQAMYGLEA